MANIFVETNFFGENWDGFTAELHYASKISSKLLYLAWFSFENWDGYSE